MEPLPEDVEASLLRGITAYLRATPATELPSGLRRFRNFRPKSLAAHKRQILDALDDGGLRGLIGEWLEKRPALSRSDADVLRVATERDEGWYERLVEGSGSKPPRARRAPRAGEALEREREKLRKAREGGRRKLEEAQREIQTLQGRIAELQLEVTRARVERDSLTKQLETARKKAAKAGDELERDRRKSRAAVERSTAAAAKARADLKDLRREVQSLRRELDRTKTAARRKPGARKKPTPAQRGPRRALPVPKGRFEDDPATLEAWLGAKDVRLLVDGYNASMSQAGFAHLDLAAQRQRLVDEVVKLARRVGVPTTIVFDGSDVAGVIRQPRGLAKVHYSAADEIADDHLIGLIESMPPTPVIVATSDRELQERAASLGATVASSEQLLELLR